MANNLKTIVETAREVKGYSQRELSKKMGLSQSTYNDTINGKIKRPDVAILKKIADELDLSLELLLNAAGYGDIVNWFVSGEYENKSTKDLKNIIEECKTFKYDILDWDAKKRKQAMLIVEELRTVKNGLIYTKEGSNLNYTIDNAIEDIDKAMNDLEEIAKKYDYSKLPKET